MNSRIKAGERLEADAKPFEGCGLPQTDISRTSGMTPRRSGPARRRSINILAKPSE